MLGHKADLAFMALGPDLRELRRLQSGLQEAGLDVVDSYVSLTEISEYAGGMPDEMKKLRLYPKLPPEGKPAFCFYPMSRRARSPAELVHARLRRAGGVDARARRVGPGVRRSGAAGRSPARAGVDDFEWGVTLFAVHADDLKAVVYQLRFDRASAIYGEFGRFYTGMVTPIEELLTGGSRSSS